MCIRVSVRCDSYLRNLNVCAVSVIFVVIVPEGNDFNKPGEHRNLAHCVGNGSGGVR